MNAYQFDITLTTDADDEAEALQDAMQLLRDPRFVKEGATITVVAEDLALTITAAGNHASVTDVHVIDSKLWDDGVAQITFRGTEHRPAEDGGSHDMNLTVFLGSTRAEIALTRAMLVAALERLDAGEAS